MSKLAIFKLLNPFYSLANSWQQAGCCIINKVMIEMDNCVSLIKISKMNIEARKIEFVQEFLKLQSEEAISRLEKILKSEQKVSSKPIFEPMTQEELNQRIDQSESDFRNNRFKSSSELLAKYE